MFRSNDDSNSSPTLSAFLYQNSNIFFSHFPYKRTFFLVTWILLFYNSNMDLFTIFFMFFCLLIHLAGVPACEDRLVLKTVTVPIVKRIPVPYPVYIEAKQQHVQ